MANLRARLSALENADDGEWEILNPRTYELPLHERAAAEEANRRRVAEALAEMRAGGRRVITIPNPRSYD